MIPNHFYIFTIFKCDYNVGITIWRCLSNYCIRYLCTYIKSHLDVFQNYIQSASAGILHNYTVSANPWNLWKLSDDRKPPHQEIEEILANDAVEAAFSIIYLRLLFSSGLNFSIKYILYTPLKFCCHRKLQKTP